jgi:predicted nucleic acid-binding protein
LIVADTSGLLAALDRDSRVHEPACAIVAAASTPLVISPFVLGELDYLVATRLGRLAELDLLEQVATGAHELVVFTPDDLEAAVAVVRRYADLGIGLTDASLVVLADRYRTNRIFTLDERHFRALEPLGGGAFELLPADA